jgi:hypothetical protein
MARYKIKNIQKMDSPDGMEKINGYKFIIENDKNSIMNWRAGSKKEVLNFARESVERLNEKYYTHVHFKTHKPVYEMESSLYQN